MSHRDRGFLSLHLVGTSPLEGWLVGGLMTTPSSFTTLTPSVDTLYAVPLMSTRGGTLDRVGFEVTTVGGAGSVSRVGLYKATSKINLYPSALAVDGGEKDTTAVGGTGIKTSTISTSLDRDTLYWLAFLCGTAAPTLRAFADTYAWGLLGCSSSNFQKVGWGIDKAQAYGALPDPFPASGTILYSVDDVAIPVLTARFSA